jgi:hypothetical protein
MDAAQFLSGAVLKKSLKRVPVKLMHKSSQRTPRGSLSPLLGRGEGWGEGHNLSC